MMCLILCPFLRNSTRSQAPVLFHGFCVPWWVPGPLLTSVHPDVLLSQSPLPLAVFSVLLSVRPLVLERRGVF